MRRSLWRTKVVGALALAATLTLSACGGSTTTAANGSSGSSGSTHVTIGVGGQSLLVYLPTTLAAQLGYYKAEGLDVGLQDLQAGSKALTALVGGSVDVTSGYYDHTIQTQAKGKSIESFVTMLQLPALVLAVSPKSSKPINDITDLKGLNVGVTAPGSSTDFFLKYLLDKAGLGPNDVSTLGIGGGATAVAAMEQGKVDAAVLIDPAVTELQKRVGNLQILRDLRTEKGVEAVYGVQQYPAAVLYSQTSWVKDNPETAGKLARAITRTLTWISQHSAEEIAAKMPPQFAGTDKDVYIKAVAAAKPTYSKDGVMPKDGAEAVLKVLSFDPEIAKANIDIAKTYTNKYVS